MTKKSAYQDGWDAYHAGRPMECPYKRTERNTTRRQNWYDGYLDAKYPNSKYEEKKCYESYCC